MGSADVRPRTARRPGTNRAGAAVAVVDSVPTVRYLTLAGLILLAALPFRVWNLGGVDMWTDEVLTALRARVPLSDALDSILGAGNQAPLYYLMMQVLPHDTDFMLRLPSVLLGLVNIALLIGLIDRLYGDRVLALQLGALLAVSPLHVILSRTARFYTLLLLFGLIVMLLFVRILRGHRSRWMWFAFWLCSLLAYLTHYSALALPAAQGVTLALFWRHYRAILVRWGAVQALAGVPPALWVMLASDEYEPVGYVGQSNLPTLGDIPITFLNLVSGFDGTWQLAALPAILVVSVGLAAGIVALLRGARAEPERLYWVAQGVLPVLLLFIMSVWVYGKYKDRYFLLLMPALMLLFVQGWRRLSPRWSYIALLVVLATNVFFTVRMFTTGSYQRTDWSDAGRYLAGQFEPGDRVMFARWTTYEAFRHSYDGSVDVLTPSFLLTERADTTAIEREARRIWVVYRDQWEDFHFQGWKRNFDPLRPGLSQMSDWLVARQDRIVSTASFDGIVIYEVMPPDA